jgi:hypothetical protein
MTELQAQDWYDLRNHVVELTPEYVRFKFPESNTPDFNNSAFENLKRSFDEITIERPLIDPPPSIGNPIREVASGGIIYVTLRFKSPQQLAEVTKMLNP